jgi:hypothetical protein
MAAVCSKPKPEAYVEPAGQVAVWAPVVPDAKQVAAVSGAVALGAGSTVRLKIFTNSARTLKLIVSRIRNVRPTLKFSVGCR